MCYSIRIDLQICLCVSVGIGTQQNIFIIFAYVQQRRQTAGHQPNGRKENSSMAWLINNAPSQHKSIGKLIALPLICIACWFMRSSRKSMPNTLCDWLDVRCALSFSVASVGHLAQSIGRLWIGRAVLLQFIRQFVWAAFRWKHSNQYSPARVRRWRWRVTQKLEFRLRCGVEIQLRPSAWRNIGLPHERMSNAQLWSLHFSGCIVAVWHQKLSIIICSCSRLFRVSDQRLGVSCERVKVWVPGRRLHTIPRWYLFWHMGKLAEFATH